MPTAKNLSVKLTREDTATDGDISSEGAFLVNVSAINSLEKTDSFVSVITIYIIPEIARSGHIHYFATASALPNRQYRQSPAGLEDHREKKHHLQLTNIQTPVSSLLWIRFWIDQVTSLGVLKPSPTLLW